MADEEQKVVVETEGKESETLIRQKIANGEKLKIDDYETCRKIRKARIKDKLN